MRGIEEGLALNCIETITLIIMQDSNPLETYELHLDPAVDDPYLEQWLHPLMVLSDTVRACMDGSVVFFWFMISFSSHHRRPGLFGCSFS